MTLEEAAKRIESIVSESQGIKGAHLAIRVPYELITSGLFPDALQLAEKEGMVVPVYYKLPYNANEKVFYLPKDTFVNVG